MDLSADKVSENPGETKLPLDKILITGTIKQELFLKFKNLSGEETLL